MVRVDATEAADLSIRRQLSDLTATLALPAMWKGREASFVVSSLLDVLVSLLRLEVAYTHLDLDDVPDGGPPLEAWRPPAAGPPPQLRACLDAAASADVQDTVIETAVSDPAWAVPLRVVVLRQQVGGARWPIVVGARRAGFPDAADRLLLSVAVEQAAIAIEAARTLRQERERAGLANLASEIGTALAQGETLHTMLQGCAEALVRHLDAAFARIWTLNAATDVLELQASAGLYTHRDGVHSRVPVGAFKIGQIAQERRPHLTNAVVGDPRVSDQEWAKREGMIAFAGYPLLVNDRLVGVMALFARHPLSRTALEAMAAVAQSIALGIERQKAAAALRDHLDVVETVSRIGQLLAGELELERLVQAVTDAATEVAGAQFGAFFYNLVDERGESYTLYTLSGAPREAFARFPMPRNTSVFGPTFRGEGIVRFDDVTVDARYGQNPPYAGMPDGHLPVRSYLAVPVIARSGEVLGGLFFGHPEPGVFTEQAERIVAGLAAQAAVAMDNARLYQAAQDALRLRDEFLGSVSHDLRTPLATISGMTQLVRRQLGRLDVPQQPRLVEQVGGIERAVARMTAMVDELLDLARLQAGQSLELHTETVDLVALARASVQELQRTAPRHQLRISAAVPALMGTWDRVRLERVLGNLLSNALKYSPDGGAVVVGVGLQDSGAGNSAHGPWAELVVTDQGMGIPAAELPYVFDRFRRGTNVQGRVSGAGLGLAGVKRIVELHDGSIVVTSTEGVGTTVTVRLPLKRTATAEAESSATSAASDHRVSKESGSESDDSGGR